MRIFRFIYNILFCFSLILYVPVYILRKKFSLNAFLNKLGARLDFSDFEQKTIWIQAVSVGEVVLVKKFLEKIRQKNNCPVVISTTTLTGYEVAKRLYNDKFTVIFFPFDISFVLKKFIAMINPSLFIAMETEIWPNLFYQLSKKKVPIIILNGRISDKAYKKYLLVKPVIKNMLKRVCLLGAQNDVYKQRFISLGMDDKKIFISGNMKLSGVSFDQSNLEIFRKRYSALFSGDKKILFVAASTHYPEEKQLLEVFDRLNKKYSIRFIIVPRHPQRAKAIEKDIKSFGFNSVLATQMPDSLDDKDVLVVDKVGELVYFYKHADICFVGGSLVDCGGHNILEPIYFGKPTIFGRFMSNFKDIENIVLLYKAGLKIENSVDFEETVNRLLTDDGFYGQLSQNCVKLFSDEEKHLQSNINAVMQFVEG